MDTAAVENVLDRCRSLIHRQLVLSPTVLDLLREDDVISETTRRKMEKMATSDQVSHLIDILRKRGTSTFKRFLEVLMKTFHSNLAEKLVLCDPVRFSDVLKIDPEPYYGPSYRPHSGVYADTYYQPYDERETMAEVRVRVPIETEKRDPLKDEKETPDDAPKTEDESSGPKFHVEHGNDIVGADDELSKLRTYFEHQQSDTERVLNALKQEEVVIRELLEQNLKEQEQFRQNRSTLEEINRRVSEISSRTGYLADAVPRLSVSNFRLSTLNSLPWTAGKTEY